MIKLIYLISATLFNFFIWVSLDFDLHCGQLIKDTPFTPRTFYIDVELLKPAEKKITQGYWLSTVKDESQLDEVFEYYSKE